jgi:probable F420-dependent oxidoreductase
MKFGVVFPQTEIGADPIAIRDYAQTAESLGYDYLLTYDHVLGANPERPGGWRGPYTYREMFHEPLVLFGYLAGLTQRIELVTGIVILPQRQTALVAKQAAEVDILSGGRMRLGVGIGWNQVEYESLNEDFTNRGKRIEEQVTLLRELWTKPLVKFEGKHHTVPDAGINPLPVQRPIPIWFGGIADAVLERMARLGDGWIANQTAPEKFQVAVEKLRGYLSQAGRDLSAFGLDMRIGLKASPRDQWGKEVEVWRGLGVTHLCFNTMGAGLTSAQQHIDAIQYFKAEIGVIA